MTPPTKLQPSIPDHQLLRRIGHGSYGEIWLARNILGGYRAVKIVYRANFEDARPYEREFKGIQQFEPISRSHPGFVDVLQVGRSADDSYFYYVMELADDQAPREAFSPETYAPRTLSKELAARGRLPARECVQIGIHLASALEHLHAAGLVHRDVKPSNIIFVDGQAKLADIGLVVPLSDARTFVGTEGFYPPEGPGTVTADLYGLGKVLYEICTGQSREQFPELPIEIAGFDDRDAVAELNTVVVKACAPTPKDRHQTATDLRRELELIFAGGSVKGLHRLQHQFRWAKRIAIAACALLLGFVGVTYALQRMRQRENALLAAAYVTAGLRLVEQANAHASIPYFAEALRIEADDEAAAETHRLRIGAALAHSPRLLQSLSFSNEVKEVRFSADGRHLLVAGGHQLQLVDWETGNPEFHFDAERAIESVAFHPRGDRIVVAHGRFLAMLNFAGEVLWEVSNHKKVHSAEFNPTGERLVLACADHCAHLLHATNGAPHTTLAGEHTAPLRNASFSADGVWLATAGQDGLACVWDVNTMKPVRKARHALTHWIHDVNFSPDGRRFVTASSDRSVRVWDVANGSEAALRMEHNGSVRRARFSPDGRFIASAGFDGTVRFWDAQTGRAALNTINSHSPPLHADFSPDGRCIAVGCQGGEVNVWQLDTPATINAGRGIMAEAGERYVTFGTNSFRIWNAADDSPAGAEVQVGVPIERTHCDRNATTIVLLGKPEPDETTRVEVHRAGRAPASFAIPRASKSWLSGNGKTLLTRRSETGFIWNLAGELAAPPPVLFAGRPHVATFSRDGATVLIGVGTTLHAVDAATGAEKFPAIEHTMTVEDVRFSPDEKFFLTATGDGGFDPGAVRVWDAQSGKTVGEALPHGDGIVQARFSRDGQWIASAGEDNRAKIWNAATGEPKFDPIPHFWKVLAIDWSARDRQLFTATVYEAQIWSPQNGAPVTPPLRFGPFLTEGGFCAQGKRIWVKSKAGELFLANLSSATNSPDELIAMADEAGVNVPPEIRRRRGLDQKNVVGRASLAALRESAPAWHRQRAIEAEALHDWFAAQFHWRHLLQLAPTDATARDRLAAASAHGKDSITRE